MFIINCGKDEEKLNDLLDRAVAQIKKPPQNSPSNKWSYIVHPISGDFGFVCSQQIALIFTSTEILEIIPANETWFEEGIL